MKVVVLGSTSCASVHTDSYVQAGFTAGNSSVTLCKHACDLRHLQPSMLAKSITPPPVRFIGHLLHPATMRLLYDTTSTASKMWLVS